MPTRDQHLAHDQRFLQQAIDLAVANAAGGGGPFGALVVHDGEVIGEGVNRVTAHADPTAHAEMVAIRAACARLGSFQLTGCTIYASCEPCPMCLGAIYWARPQRLVYAADRTRAAAAGFDDALIYDEIPRPPAERRLPTAHVPMGTETAPFEAWRANTDRREY
ncbi:tRNA-specific adenosine deaminase [bacterium]|nr:tRNA-specific adenosine deaminase [bacterium]